MAAPVGKILALAGEASIERAGRQLPLAQGGEVENGDLIKVGERSSLQVRFADDSIVALRANSTFKIEDFQYSRNAAADRSIFGLIKGGMRTITGLIGKANQKNYEVRTETSTIGIRGTHYVLVSCNGDCFDAGGNRMPDGTFGGVTDGRIAVANQSGEQEFGQQEFFHVPDRGSPPVRLMAPPSMLNDQALQARGRGRAAASSGSGEAGASSGSGAPQTSNSPQLATMAAPATDLSAPVTQFSVTEQPIAGTGETFVFVGSDGYANNSNGSTNVTAWKVNGSELVAHDLPWAANPAMLAQAFAAAGYTPLYSAAADAYWAHEPRHPSDPVGHYGWHSGWGTAPVAMPTQGTAVSYGFVGGTIPTDSAGTQGTFSAGGPLLMNFVTRQITNSAAMTVAFTATTYSIAANQTWGMNTWQNQALSATCSGACGSATANINGAFSGVNAQGYIAAIGVQGQISTQAHAGGVVAVFAK